MTLREKEFMFEQAVNISLKKSDSFECKVIGEQLRYSIRMKQDLVEKAEKICGFNIPRNIGEVESYDKILCMCLGPDEWILIVQPKLKLQFDKIIARLNNSITISITNISDRNIGFKLKGKKVQKYINSGCPLDLALESFPIGKASRTVFESVPILLFRDGKLSFRVECWRSFGPYISDFFKRIADTND